MDFTITLSGVAYVFDSAANTFTYTASSGEQIVLSVPAPVSAGTPTVIDVTQGEDIQIEETDAAVTAPTNESAAS